MTVDLRINNGDSFGRPSCVGRGKFQINDVDLNQIKINGYHSIVGVSI